MKTHTFFPLPNKNKKIERINYSDIVYLEGNINYTTFYLQCGKEKMVAHSIKFFEAYLEKRGFLRIHRSYMVNPNYVKSYNKESEVLTMSNGHNANISRRRKFTIEGLIG